MSEVKHTPGPWQLENGQWGDHSEDAGGGFHLLMGEYEAPDGIGIRSARLLQYGDGFYEGDNGFEEVEANARLIAAAPELYAALKEWAENPDGWNVDQVNHARAIIAKVEA